MARIPLVSSKKARLSMFFDKMPASEAVKMQARTKRIRKGFGARKFK
ncbi:MAG: hypothetical protein KGH77_04665 [Candidatus Micrarchaeota archaeon]|nr:hypothetical protein [Candidatus Micrarchaeota archaeon]